MKGLILKDLYNIGHNAKTMLLVLVVLGVCLAPTTGLTGYQTTCALMCAMMVVTTFSFDDMAGWMSYALVLPVSRREIVWAKYLVLAIFCTVGDLLGGAAGALVMVLLGQPLPPLGEMAALLLFGWALAYLTGSASIPLLLRFGAEKARIILVGAFMIPVMLILAVGGILSAAGVTLTDELAVALFCASPLVALAAGAALGRIACAILNKKEY